jgi:hypothetical protein
MADFNRVSWMVIFLLGAGIFVWLEWQGGGGSTMVWFLLASLWSAVCGISYTVLDWFIERKHIAIPAQNSRVVDTDQ